jgi:hypothetical protein
MKKRVDQKRGGWFEVIKEKLKMTSDEVGLLARDRDPFRRDVEE